MNLKKSVTHLLLFLLFSLLHSVAGLGQMRQIYTDLLNTNINEIKKVSFYSPSNGYIASTGGGNWVGYTSDSGRTITKRHITFSNVNYNGYSVNLPFLLRGVKAFGQDTIIAYGGFNLTPSILYSTDGGLTYLLVYHSQFSSTQIGHVYDMVFPQNTNTGFAVDGYRILKTSDKGKNWSAVYTTNTDSYGALDAIDNNTVFAFSNSLTGTGGGFVKTTNSGLTWQTITPPNPFIQTVDFITETKGWVNVSQNPGEGLVYHTSNGGTTWIKKNDEVSNPISFNKVQFINDSIGFGISMHSYNTYKTTDTGRVWEPLPRDNNFRYFDWGHTDIQVLNQNQLWSGGGKEFLEISTNGGGTPLPKAYFKADTTNVYATNIVSLINNSKRNYQYKWIVNGSLISTSYNTSYLHNLSSQVDTISLIVISGSATDTLTTYQSFVVPNLPVISSFAPAAGSLGTLVSIKGVRFTNVVSVKFGNTPAQSFVIAADTLIQAVVGSGSTGSVSVSLINGTYSLSQFTYVPPPSSPPPVITSFTPESGPVGTSITITGSNFSTNSANNIIYFGATKANISSSTSTQILCTVPLGASYEPISILTTNNGLTGFSLKPFNVTFADSGNFTKSSFSTAFKLEARQGNPNYPIFNPAPIRALGKDVDGDGKPDLICSFDALANNLGDSITIYRSLSTPNNIAFAYRKNIGRHGSSSLHMHDLDGDGKLDIFGHGFSTFNYKILSFIKNLSTPGIIEFDSPLLRVGPSSIEALAVEDIDHDGRLDISLFSYSAKKIVLIRNTSNPGTISFGADQNIQLNNNVRDSKISFGDLDGDGKKEMVTFHNIESLSPIFSVYKNISSPGIISFAPKVDFNLCSSVPGLNIQSYSLVDFDNDNKLDIVFMGFANAICVYRNISTAGNFDFATTTFPFTGSINGWELSNLSGDSKPDLVLSSSLTDGFSLRRNASVPGTISLDPTVFQRSSSQFNLYAKAADFDLDGKIDLVTKAYSIPGYDAFLIYKNKVGDSIDITACSNATKQIFADLDGTSYQWQQNTGSGFQNISNNSLFSGTQTVMLTINNTPISLNNTKYRCVVDGYYSSTFVLHVGPPITASVSITTPTTSICAGSAVTFTATPVNGGSNPSYQWQVNGTGLTLNSNTFTTTSLLNGYQVRVLMSNNAVCANPIPATSNTIVMTVNATTTPAVTVAASSTNICTGTSVTFTATPTNGGATPTYQWQVNGINRGTNSNTFTSTSLTNNDQVQVILTSSLSCASTTTATSNVITISVNSTVAPAVSLMASSTNICNGASVTFTATPTNGGTSPSYQWQVNGANTGNNNATFTTTTLTNGAQVRVIMTSSLSCASPTLANSNIITMVVNSSVSPSIVVSGISTVLVGQNSSLSVVTSNGGTSPQYQWQDSTAQHGWQNINSATATTLTYFPQLTGDKVRCILTSNAPCASPVTVVGTAIQFTVNTITPINPVAANIYGITYYPNPATSNLYVDSLKLSDKWQTLDVVALNGKNVLLTVNVANHSKKEISVNHLASGQYIIVLRRKNGTAAFLKFLKF